MFLTTNPFIEIAGLEISTTVMQAYVILMVILVIGGTIIDIIHKKSAEYFFENAKNAKKVATRSVGTGEKTSLAMQTLASEVLTSSEFCNQRRRISHLFTMYGFILFVATTVIMIFGYSAKGAITPPVVPLLWHIGAMMLCFGGYWFWFFIRVDISAEGNKWYKLVPADLFIVSLLTMATFALTWSLLQSLNVTGWSTLFFILFIAASSVLFGGVLWSKFAHMFFKPAAAFQKRMTKADGSRENLPELADRTTSADSDRHSMELLKDAPLDMGLGIKREAPRHY